MSRKSSKTKTKSPLPENNLLEFEAKVREGIEAAIANNAPPGCNTKTESPEAD
jgi:hypothetical protein